MDEKEGDHMPEMLKTSIKMCRKCKYVVCSSSGSITCGYLGSTGKRRLCNVGECDKFEIKTKKRRSKSKYYFLGEGEEENEI